MERRELARLWMLTGTAADRLRARVKSTRSLTVAIDEADELVKLLDRCTAALREILPPR